uniref:chemotaxis protein CheW n=1 Tax=Burkholderia glumae TaxID=337 RepID=UPI003D161ACB
MSEVHSIQPAAAGAGASNRRDAAQADAAGQEFLVFTLGDEEYGIDILKVQEIRGYDSVTRIANAPEFIKGVIDHTFYDTNSILRFISRVHGLAPLDGVAARDRAFAARGATPPGDLVNALTIG